MRLFIDMLKCQCFFDIMDVVCVGFVDIYRNFIYFYQGWDLIYFRVSCRIILYVLQGFLILDLNLFF